MLTINSPLTKNQQEGGKCACPFIVHRLKSFQQLSASGASLPDPHCVCMCVWVWKSYQRVLMKFCGEVEHGPGRNQILLAIRILSWILDHFQDSLPLADRPYTDIFQYIWACDEIFGRVGRCGPRTNRLLNFGVDPDQYLHGSRVSGIFKRILRSVSAPTFGIPYLFTLGNHNHSPYSDAI